MLCSRNDCCSEGAIMPSLCFVDLRVTLNGDLIQCQKLSPLPGNSVISGKLVNVASGFVFPALSV